MIKQLNHLFICHLTIKDSMLTIGHHIDNPTIEHIIGELTIVGNLINEERPKNLSMKYAMQIFNIGPRTYNPNNLNRKQIKVLCDKNEIELYSHANYLINLSVVNKINSSTIYVLKLELDKAAECGAKGVVVHVAKCTADELKAVIELLDSKLNLSVPIILEAKASKPYSVLNDIDGIIEIDKYLHRYPHRWGICIDTAHLWAYGNNLRDPTQLDEILNKLAECKHIYLMHFNDSSNELGSGKDKHANLCDGEIFTKPLVDTVLKWCIKNDVTIIFESHANPIDNYKLCLSLLNLDKKAP